MDGASMASVGAGLVIIGVGIGIGLVGHGTITSIGRQPEAAPKLQTLMLIVAALIEGIALFAMVICFLSMK